MFKNCALEQQAGALFNLLIVKHEHQRCIGELSMQDVIELVKFLHKRNEQCNS